MRAASPATTPALLSNSSSGRSAYCEESRLSNLGVDSMCALTRAVMRATGGAGGASWLLLGFVGSLPLLPFRLSVLTTSFTIPQARHFWNRQNWQRFLLLLSTGQFLSARQTYLAFFCTVLLKNPLQPSQVRTP